MRKNQVTIKIDRFGDEAPEGCKQKTIEVYADSNDIWEALAAAFKGATTEICKDTQLPNFGRLDISSNTTKE